MEEIHSIQSSNYFVTIINEDVSNSSLSLQTYRSLARSEILFLWNVIFILCIHGFNKRLVGKENHQRTGLSRWKDSAVCVVASTLLVYFFVYFFCKRSALLKNSPKDVRSWAPAADAARWSRLSECITSTVHSAPLPNRVAYVQHTEGTEIVHCAPGEWY